jgi:transcriptional regulator with XRE-family HTH domain
LRQSRIAAGLNQARAAAGAGVEYRSWAIYEGGYREPSLARILGFCGVCAAPQIVLRDLLEDGSVSPATHQPADVPRRLFLARTAAGVSLLRAGMIIPGGSAAGLARYERGAGVPSLSRTIALAACYGVSSRWLAGFGP